MTRVQVVEIILAREQRKREIALVVMQLFSFGCMLYEPEVAGSLAIILVIGLVFSALQEILG